MQPLRECICNEEERSVVKNISGSVLLSSSFWLLVHFSSASYAQEENSINQRPPARCQAVTPIQNSKRKHCKNDEGIKVRTHFLFRPCLSFKSICMLPGEWRLNGSLRAYKMVSSSLSLTVRPPLSPPLSSRHTRSLSSSWNTVIARHSMQVDLQLSFLGRIKHSQDMCG